MCWHFRSALSKAQSCWVSVKCGPDGGGWRIEKCRWKMRMRKCGWQTDRDADDNRNGKKITVSREKAKKLTVSRKKAKILTVNHKSHPH